MSPRIRPLLLGTALALSAQNAGDTLPLGPALNVPPFDAGKAVYDTMETVGTTVTSAKTEGVDKTLEIAQNHFQNLSQGNRHAAKQLSGMPKGADARAWQANQGGRANTLGKIKLVGDLIEIFDAFSSAGGYLAEGDTTGAGAILINALGKKGASAAGAGLGSVLGPAGAIVGAEGGDRAYKAYVEDRVNKAADDKRVRDAKATMLGLPQSGRYTGSVIWVAQAPYDARSGAPPMSVRFQGPMTADLDRDGNLKIHYALKGTLDGLGVAGATMGISMGYSVTTTGDLTGLAKNGTFEAKGTSHGTSHFKADFSGMPNAPQPQTQDSTFSGAMKASGTFTRETLTGTLTSPNVQAKPMSFVLTKER